MRHRQKNHALLPLLLKEGLAEESVLEAISRMSLTDISGTERVYSPLDSVTIDMSRSKVFDVSEFVHRKFLIPSLVIKFLDVLEPIKCVVPDAHCT